MRFSTTTFLLNSGKAGPGRQYLHQRIGARHDAHRQPGERLDLQAALLPNLEAELGVFANMPFGHDTEVSQVRPIMRLTYQPTEQISAVIGTLHVPHQEFHNAPCSTGAIASCAQSNKGLKC
jgi:hypothetical protein